VIYRLKSFITLIVLGISLVVITSCSPGNKTLDLIGPPYSKELINNLPFNALPKENFEFGYFTSPNGYELRYGKALIESPKGTIILISGQSEFIESYFELINDFNDRNYDVWIMDWYGQGGSEHRSLNHTRAENNFLNDQKDLQKFVYEVVINFDQELLSIVAHSMGAHIVLSAIQNGFIELDKVVLSSPMITIRTGAFSHGLSSLVANTASNLGADWWFAPGNAEWTDKSTYRAEDNENTSDPIRSFLKQNWRRHAEHTRKSYGVTLGWINNYVQSRDRILGSKNLVNVKTRILMTVPGLDVLVLPEDSLKLCDVIYNCSSIFYAKARHELYLEKDLIRDKWIKDILSWISE